MSIDQVKASAGASGHSNLPRRQLPLAQAQTGHEPQQGAARPGAAAAMAGAAPGKPDRATADSVIQAMLTENNRMGDGKLPVEFSVDPMVLTESVAREMAQKLNLTIEESMLLQKMRATEALPDQGGPLATPAPANSAGTPANAYGDLAAKLP